jgi:DNA helicase-2/ATP-dependent DNA helicase PcrA
VCADDDEEATSTADRVVALVRSGIPAREIAVLYRTNGQSEAFEEALAERGVGYVVRGAARFFDRDEVRRAVLALRAAAFADPRGEAEVPVVVREALSGVGWAEDPPGARGAARERWDSLQALVALADGWDGDLRGFVAHLDERADAQHAPVVDGVTLCTLHAAKGLEWDVVFLVGLSDGLVPISLAETEVALAEEKRLLYVGITRARTHLTLSYARARAAGGRATRKRTRFLDRIWPDARPAPARVPPRPAADALDARDLAVFEALKVWRRAHAETDGKPAFTVLIDATLAEIAQRRPRTRGDLGKVRGMGPAKLDRYGVELLEILEGFAEGRRGSRS